MNNLSLVNIFGETGRLFYNINYMLNSKHLSLVNKIGDKTEFTITRVHCTYFHANKLSFAKEFLYCLKVANKYISEVISISSQKNQSVFVKPSWKVNCTWYFSWFNQKYFDPSLAVGTGPWLIFWWLDEMIVTRL